MTDIRGLFVRFIGATLGSLKMTEGTGKVTRLFVYVACLFHESARRLMNQLVASQIGTSEKIVHISPASGQTGRVFPAPLQLAIK